MFDTHKFVRKSQEAGFEEKQAEGISEPTFRTPSLRI